MSQHPSSPPGAERWENEGGSLRPLPTPESLGIKRVLLETFTVGGYSYTNLADAIAEAHRQRRRSELG